MATSLTYVIKFVADMEKAVRFHVDQLDLKLRFSSPEWSEFETGATTLALHVASAENPAGTCQLGLGVANIQEFYSNAMRKGVEFTSPPFAESPDLRQTMQNVGVVDKPDIYFLNG